MAIYIIIIIFFLSVPYWLQFLLDFGYGQHTPAHSTPPHVCVLLLLLLLFLFFIYLFERTCLWLVCEVFPNFYDWLFVEFSTGLLAPEPSLPAQLGLNSVRRLSRPAAGNRYFIRPFSGRKLGFPLRLSAISFDGSFCANAASPLALGSELCSWKKYKHKAAAGPNSAVFGQKPATTQAFTCGFITRLRQAVRGASVGGVVMSKASAMPNAQWQQ